MQTIVSTEPVYTFTVTGNRKLIALFEPDIPSYTVTLSIDPDQADWGTVSGGGTFEEGASVTVTATPTEGYKFVAWQEGGAQVSTDAEYTFQATKNIALVAVFEETEKYRMVEYIEATQSGTCLSLTNVPTKIADILKSRYVMDVYVAPYNSSTTSKEYLFSGTSTSTNCYLKRISNTQMEHAIMTTSPTTISSNIASKRVTIDMDIKNKALKIGTSNFGITPNTAWGFNQLRIPSPGYDKSALIKIYSVKIYTDDVLIHDYAPCVNQSRVAGLLDLIDNKFFKTSTFAFTAGPDI